MKFLCLDCDEPMRLHGTTGPDEGSLTVTFRCPECGFRVAMLTNPFETQMVQSLGVKVGGGGAAPPFEQLRSAIKSPRPDAFAGIANDAPAPDGPGCPFAEMVTEGAQAAPAQSTWTTEAEARLERIPSFIRPMARRAIERWAAEHGRATIDDAVMDEARGAFGM